MINDTVGWKHPEALRTDGRRAFTLMELIVVISIIVMLLGVLVPSFRAVKRQASTLAQKAELRNIEVGLEVWRVEHNMEYPESSTSGTTKYTFGAHKLAEAMFGRDLKGYDDLSTWDAEADEGGLPYTGSDREAQKLELGRIEAAQISQLTTVAIKVTYYKMVVLVQTVCQHMLSPIASRSDGLVLVLALRLVVQYFITERAVGCGICHLKNNNTILWIILG